MKIVSALFFALICFTVSFSYFSTSLPKKTKIEQRQDNKNLGSPLSRGEVLYRKGDVNYRIPACITCHGSQGMGNAQAGFPILSGQHLLYTIKQLKAFKDKSRKNDLQAIMQEIASRMSEEDMEAVADYIQNLGSTKNFIQKYP